MSSEGQAQLYHLLEELSSQDTYRMKSAEDQLKVFETSPLFYSTLQEFAYSQQFPFSIRWFAIIYLKNGIDKYWR